MKLIKLIFFVGIFLLLVESILGLGVSPGIIEIDFEPNLQTSFEMRVINYPAKNYDVEVYYNPNELDEEIIYEFEDIVSFENNKLSFNSDEPSKSLSINLNFPEGFSKGGVHELRIGAAPWVNSNGGLSVRTGNEIRLFINVDEKYVNEKYAKIKGLKILEINSEDVNPEETSKINLRVKSESEVLLEEVYAKIKISKQGNELNILETKKLDISPGEEVNLSILFNVGNYESGNYDLDVEAFYGSDSIKGKGSLKVLGEGGGLLVEEKKFLINWWIVLGIVGSLLFFILILIIVLLLKKNKKIV
jgi:hypothetical protein